jgi:polyribonucleotide nucleotidyltransferase
MVGIQHQVMDCAKAFVGKIIGRGGEVITMIQQRSGAKVQIDQNVAEGETFIYITKRSPKSSMSFFCLYCNIFYFLFFCFQN